MSPNHDMTDAEWLQFDPLPKRSRVVTHMRMAKRITTQHLILAAVLAVLAFLFYQKVQDDHRLAVATGQYDLCWTDGCKSDVSYGYYLK